MPSRKVLAFHLVFGAYGFWLPNDPRGSWSRYVGSRELHKFGDATKTTVSRSVAHARHDHEQRLAAKRALKFPPVQLTGIQARAVARSIESAANESQYVVHACAAMPDHVHLVLAPRGTSDASSVTLKHARPSDAKNNGIDEKRPVWARGVGRSSCMRPRTSSGRFAMLSKIPSAMVSRRNVGFPCAVSNDARQRCCRYLAAGLARRLH